MSFIDLAKRRYSCRNYQERKVEEDKLRIILEAGRVAPTAANHQPQRLLVIRSEEGMKKVAKAANTFHAPLVIVVCTDKNTAWTRPLDSMKTTDIDASIVTDHMMLAAADLGLGSVWICYFDQEILKKEFNIPDHYVPVNILAIGYEAGEGKPADRHESTRKAITETVSYETF